MIASESAWVGQDIAKNRYRIENRLSQTGLACTYLAYDRRLQTRVVVKTPRPELVQRDPKLCDRFTNQVQTLVRLACPHIISVLDFGKHGSLPFVVLQHLEGGSLADWICTQPNRQRQPQLAVRLHKWLLDVASTLDFIHQNKHVHRDVQPATILFDSQQHVFLADFGVVKALSENTADGRMLTTVGQQVIGTPAYMAPELIRGQKVDGGIDQWSLAVTVYEFLSGRMPFAGQMPAQVLASQTQRKPLPLPQIRPDLPNGLWPALQRALSVNPGERYPTCTQFAQAVLQTVEETSRSAAAANNPPIERTVLQAQPKQPAQPQPAVRPSPQQYVTANAPAPPAGPFSPPQPSHITAPGDQMAARRNRTRAPAGGSRWAVLVGAVAASVIVTAILLCVIGKTQRPAFLAALVTPSSQSDDGPSEAKAEARRYKRLLQEEKDRADKQRRDSQNEISNLKADANYQKNRYTNAAASAKSYRAVAWVQNKTNYDVVLESRFRMWDGTYTKWKRYTDKANKGYLYNAIGGVHAEIRIDYTISNGKLDWSTYTLRCEMVPTSTNTNSVFARNRYHIVTYSLGSKTYLKLVHQSPSL